MTHCRKLGFFLATLIASCATPTAQKDADEGVNDDKRADEQMQISANFQTMTYSFSNNPLSSKTYSQAKAREVAGELEAKLAAPTTKDRKDVIALMAAKRLAGDGIGPVFQVAKKLMIAEMKDDIRNQMPEVAQLELVLASIQSRQIPMAEHWILKLLDSKNDRIKAAALTARGMIALQDGRLPEAIADWNAALSVRKDYEPARLNIGFFALRFGDYKMAKAMFSGLGEDFFLSTGLIQAERLADNPKEAQNYCASLSDKRKNYKPGLFSCALNDYQGLGNAAKARSELEALQKIEGGPQQVDDRAAQVLAGIDRDLREQQMAKDKAAAAAAAKVPQPAAGSATPQSPEAAQPATPSPNGANPPAANTAPEEP